jgi:hypothetical protein
MRESVKAFYYPKSACRGNTLAKAILLFDEVHFADRPSFMFNLGGSFGMVGSASPLRNWEASFRDEGVPLFVHGAPGGPVEGQLLQQVTADITDPEFLKTYQTGLRESDAFCELQIARGNYGNGETHETLARKLAGVDLSGIADPLALLQDASIAHFDVRTDEGVQKNFVSHAMECSAVMNFALDVSAREGVTPLADALPFGNLLGTKHKRAIRTLGLEKTSRVGELSFAIFDEVVPAHVLESLSLKDVIRYRRSSQNEREAFLEYLVHLEGKLRTMPVDDGYSEALSRFVESEVMPGVRQYRNSLQKVYDKLFGSITQSILATAAAGGTVQVFTDLSWASLLRIAALGSAAIAKFGIDAAVESRALKRESALAYLINI